MPNRRTVIVTLTERAGDDLPGAVASLRRSGLEVTETLEFLGQVTGICDEGVDTALGQLPEVDSVEISGEVKALSPRRDRD